MKRYILIGAVLLLAMLMVVPVAAAGQYRDMNPANDIPDPESYGYAKFYIRAGGSAEDLTVYIRNVKQEGAFDSRYNPDRTSIGGQNPGWLTMQVLPDGVSETTEPMSSSETYEACIRNGNGGQPECQRFTVGGAQIARVAFLGHAVSANTPAVCQMEIVSAEYGATAKVCEDVTYTSKNYKCGYHLEYRYRVGEFVNTNCRGRGQCNGYCDYSQSEWSEWIDFLPRASSTSCVQIETHWAKHTQVCKTVGGYSDVTQKVRDVLAQGYTTFLFSNGHGNYYGGIWDVTDTSLLSEINDPARDIKKSVSITYKDCSGIEKTINAEEYEVITLV